MPGDAGWHGCAAGRAYHATGQLPGRARLVQARMCVELEVAVAQAAESHAQAMAVSRAAEARVAALQAELDSSRQEAREAMQLAQALRQSCNAEQQASKSGPRGHQGGAEQAAQVSRLEAQVALLEGQPEALRAVGPEELQQVVARLESALAAARAVQLQAPCYTLRQLPMVCWRRQWQDVIACAQCVGRRIETLCSSVVTRRAAGVGKSSPCAPYAGLQLPCAFAHSTADWAENNNSHTWDPSTEGCSSPNTVRDKCFKLCITSPGTSLSSSDQKCLSRCMDRYQDVGRDAAALECMDALLYSVSHPHALQATNIVTKAVINSQ
ncbi:hypothetical protein QJQ45_018324 [Haematococcus lacustris]|nr:hypothetical protein QJQ45_018324 [Haematococcus lacustris]